MPRPTLSASQAQRVLDAMRRLKDDRFKGSVSELARALGRRQPSVTQLLAGKHGPSYQTAVVVAKLLGITVWQLFGEAALDPLVLAIERPNLAAAIELSGDKISGGARERVLAAARFLPDLPLSAWVTLLLETSAFSEEQSRKKTA